LRLSGFSGFTGFTVAGDAGKVEAELDASALLIISFTQLLREWNLTMMIRKSLRFPLFILMYGMGEGRDTMQDICMVNNHTFT
jgi:hypothetical protein